jgi:hypothetical protein
VLSEKENNYLNSPSAPQRLDPEPTGIVGEALSDKILEEHYRKDNHYRGEIKAPKAGAYSAANLKVYRFGDGVYRANDDVIRICIHPRDNATGKHYEAEKTQDCIKY